MKLNIIELFSGIGGFSKGLMEAGFIFNDHYFSEIDKHAIANYKYNFSHAKCIGSVQSVLSSGINTPDIITFGSPCQDFSLAGKQSGLEGERSVLILEAIEILRKLRPSVFIWENVKGAYSSNDGADFWAIISAFANIGGYRLEWQLLNTSWFLPQNRERIYLVGHLAGKSESGIFPFAESDFRIDSSQANSQRERKRIRSNNKSANTISGRYGKDGSECLIEENLTLIRHRSDQCFQERTISPSVRNGDKGEVRIVTNTKNGYDNVNKGDSINFSNPNSITRRGRVGRGVAQTLDTQCNQGIISHYGHINKEAKFSKTSPTLKAQSHGHEPMTNDKTGIRRLTEIEVERLQGFPDDWTKFGNYDGVVKQIPKTQRYKLCGNAVTTNVVKAIGERLKFNAGKIIIHSLWSESTPPTP